MVFHVIQIQHPTPRVLGKLRKGQKVRIMSGSGMNLIVSAGKYNPVTKSFGKGKAFTIELTPEEIQANMNPPTETGEMEGQGLFDSLKKVGRVIAPVAKEVGRVALPLAKKHAKKAVQGLANYAPELGATLGASALSGLALLAGQPELVPLAAATGETLGKAGGKELGKIGKREANKRIDRFDPYGEQRGNAPPSRRPDFTGFQSVVNTASSALGKANLSQYLDNLSNEDIEMELARRMGGGYSTPFDTTGGRQVLSQYADPLVGQGLYAQGRGRGIRSRMKHRETASIGIHGNLLGYGLPPALQSQPYSSNFQMASRLPPAFAPIIRQGAGLY